MMDDLHTKFLSIGKAVDLHDPIPPTQRPRGYGGVAILYSKHLEPITTIIQDGDHRIQAIILQTEPRPIIIICLYMPCRGSPKAEEEFETVLAQLTEILAKWPEALVVIGGDWNVELSWHPTSKRQKLAAQFIETQSLRTSFKQEVGATFVHSNGVDTSCIDYICTSVDTSIHIEHYTKSDGLYMNTSDHYPITVKLKITGQPTKHTTHSTSNADSASTQGETETCRINWNKVDTNKYTQTIEHHLQNQITRLPDSISQLEVELLKFQDLLYKAAWDASPPKPKKQNKKGKQVWSPTIKEATLRCKTAHKQWKQAGKSKDPNDASLIERAAAKKALRREIRTSNAIQRNKNTGKILKASGENKKLFFQLINRQRKGKSQTTTELIVNGTPLTSEEDICNGWKTHFSELAKPSENRKFDEEYLEDIEFDVEWIQYLLKDDSIPPSFTFEEITTAVKSLNTGKAPDAFGLMAEHLIKLGVGATEHMLVLLNCALQLRKAPTCMKLGVLTPIYKKKKEKNLPSNYRGITVVSVIGKLWEKLIKERIVPTLAVTQNCMQRGFTKHTSPMNAALLLHEQFREVQTTKQELYVAFLDAKSAFDVVSHPSLLRKMFLDGIDDYLWELLRDTFIDAKTRIKWGKTSSSPFDILQGVRQGGTLSTEEYKRYNNPLLQWLGGFQHGCRFGAITCPAPTCADDIALVANSREDLQCLLDAAHIYSTKERFELQPAKSMILALNTATPYELLMQDSPWLLGDVPIPVVESAPHLGILHDTGSCGVKTTLDQNIKKARGALYALMGAGLHGKNGLTPQANIHLLQIYVIPILLHGLEILLPTDTNLKIAIEFYENTLRMLISTSQNTAKPAIYILTGAIPLQALIHLKALSLYRAIASDPTSVEWKIAERQILMGNKRPKSWFNSVKETLAKYDLPMAYDLLTNPPQKEEWKRTTKKAVLDYWKKDLISRTRGYPSLKYISAEGWCPGTPYYALKDITDSPIDIRRVPTMARILTGTMTLQANRRQFNQTNSEICLLCHEEPETRDHFIRCCPALEEYRNPFITAIKIIFATRDIIPDEKNITEAILNPSYAIEGSLDELAVAETLFQTRKMLYKLELKRRALLNEQAKSRARNLPD